MQLAHVITSVRHLFSGTRKARPTPSEGRTTDQSNGVAGQPGSAIEPDFISDIFPALLVRESQGADSAHSPAEAEHVSLPT